MSIRCASCGLDLLVARSSGCPRCGAKLRAEPDAKILGDLSGVPGDFSVLEGASAEADGTTSTFFFYSSSGLVGTDAVLVRTSLDQRKVPCTPYEIFVLGAVDGRRSIRDIRRGSLLRRREMLITVLTLLEKGLVEVAAPVGPPHVPEVEPEASTEDILADYLREGAALPPMLDPAFLVEDVRPPPRARDDEGLRRARRLYETALEDEARGELLSARMNLKLALTFDAKNRTYLAKLEEVSRAIRTPKVRAPGRIPQEIITAQREGRLDRAIELLEARVASRPNEPETLNMLGVLLAMHAAQYKRAADLVERATELAPTNETYAQNLAKILSRAATAELSKPAPKKKTKP